MEKKVETQSVYSFFLDEMIELEHHRRTGSASRPVKYVRHISHDPEQLPRRRRSSRSRGDSP